MTKFNSDSINSHIGRNVSVLVVCDVPAHDVFDADLCMTLPEKKLFMREARACGFEEDDFMFVTPAGPLPQDQALSDGKVGKHVDAYHNEFHNLIGAAVEEHGLELKAVVTLGKWAARQMAGSAVQITRIRGTLQETRDGLAYLPCLSPREVLRFPDRKDIYCTDFAQLSSLAECGWSVDEFRESAQGTGYRWTLDLEELLDDPPDCIALDTETVGVEFRKPGFRVLTAQITRKKGESLVIPLDLEWWNNERLMSPESRACERLTVKKRRRLIGQIRELVGNPDVHVVMHNGGYDLHVLRTLGIEVANWYADTIQLAFVVDENMQSKSLSDCVRRWLPQFSGYCDTFDLETDKSRMDLVNHAPFLKYAGGDTEVTYRLANVLLKKAKEDESNWNTFVKVQMPALRMFKTIVERKGVRIDTTALRELGAFLAQSEEEVATRLIRSCPRKLLRRYAQAQKPISFDSPDFLIDLLFGPDGIRVDGDEVVEKGGRALRPCVFTKGGKPSTSGKQHLPYFENVGFVRDLMELKTIRKMRTTYVGEEAKTDIIDVDRLKTGDVPKPVKDALATKGIVLPKVKGVRRRSPIPGLAEKFAENGADDVLEVDGGSSKGSVLVDLHGNVQYKKTTEASGFWRYIPDLCEPRIYPSFWMHRTVTGRSASSNPNGSNLPKRGELAEAYRKIFVADEGEMLGEVDLSQAELRIAAAMAGEREMLRIYNNDGDIHASTAAAIMGITEEVFTIGSHDDTPLIEVANIWPGSGQYLQKLSGNDRRTVTVAKYCKFKRFCAKAVNFGFLYGMGWRKFKSYARTDYKIAYSDEEAEATREMFFAKYPRLKAWHEAMREFLKRKGYVRALHGSLRRLPNIDSDDDLIVGMASRMGINAPVQRMASDLAVMGAVRFSRDADPEDMSMRLFIHDSNVVGAKSARIEEAVSALKFYMETIPLEEWFNITLPVKIAADAATGPSLCDMTERPDIPARRPEWFRAGEYPRELAEGMEERWEALLENGVIIPG